MRCCSITTTFNINQAILLAAGFGTRLLPYTQKTPKPLLPLMGVPVAQFIFDQLSTLLLSELVVNVHHLPEKIQLGFKQLERDSKLNLKFSLELKQILGSAGGLRQAQSFLSHPEGPFFWLNADVLTENYLVELAQTHQRLKRSKDIVLTLLLHPGQGVLDRYREIILNTLRGRYTSEGVVHGLGEPTTGKAFFTGTAVVESDFLSDLSVGVPAEVSPDRLHHFIKQGRVGYLMLPPGALWLDIGTPQNWLRAHIELIERLETGRVSQKIERRITKNAYRMAHGVWVDRNKFKNSFKSSTFLFHAPCFFSGHSTESLQKYLELGPATAVYGEVMENEKTAFTLFYEGHKSTI